MTGTAKRTTNKTPATADAAQPRLLSGGNPQIAKGYGNAPVAAYIAALPGWKQDAARRLDALIEQTVPGVRRAVKWNSPLYGIGEGDRWFLGLHTFAKYLKVAFFDGTALDPMPPVGSKNAATRYVHITEDGFDADQFADWIAQASRLNGVKM